MKISPNFIKHEIEDQVLFIPIGNNPFHGVIRINKTADFIFKCISKQMDISSIKSAMIDKYEGTDDEFKEAIEYTISELKRNGVIEE